VRSVDGDWSHGSHESVARFNTFASVITVCEITKMDEFFTAWARWWERSKIPGLNYPGVYVLAITSADISGSAFSWLRSVAYVGMTNARGGLKSSLQQFDNTIKGKSGHGGAFRVRFKHHSYETLIADLYVAVAAFPCDVSSHAPRDLRVMGDVARFEYECMARYAERYGCLPEFNDQKRSPKK